MIYTKKYLESQDKHLKYLLIILLIIFTTKLDPEPRTTNNYSFINLMNHNYCYVLILLGKLRMYVAYFFGVNLVLLIIVKYVQYV